MVWEGGPCTSVKARLEELLTARSRDVAARISELTAFGADLAQAREDLAAPSPAGPCDDNCGCTSSQVHTVQLSRPRPIGPAVRTSPSQPTQTWPGGWPFLAACEKECCSFFAFTLDMAAAGSITLHIRAPQGAEPLVAELLGQLDQKLALARVRCC